MSRLSAGSQAQLFLTKTTGKTSEVISVTLGTAPETMANADGAAVGGSSLSATPGPSSAAPEPALPWPDARLESRQNDKVVSAVPVKTSGGTMPGGWSGQLVRPTSETLDAKP